jgi:hypothetical protein
MARRTVGFRVPLLALALAAAPAAAIQVEIHTYWIPEAENSFTFLLGDRELCSFSGRAPAGRNSTDGVCRFELPAKARQLTVRGRITRTEWNSRTDEISSKSAAGARTLDLRDASAITAPLRDAALPVAVRWRRAIAAEAELVAGFGSYASLSIEAPASAAEIAAAEQRLGFALPADYRELVSAAGVPQLGDSYVAPVGELVTADRTILHQWGYGDPEHRQWIPEAAIERLKRSVVLFFEVGDGMGGQLFLAPPNAPCGERFATMYFHEEDGMAPAMRDLAADRLGCASFDETLLGHLESLVLLQIESDLATETGELLFDFSAPVQKFNLRYSVGDDGEFEVDLSRE